MNFTEKEINNIGSLLMSTNPSNHELAFQYIQQAPQQLIPLLKKPLEIHLAYHEHSPLAALIEEIDPSIRKENPVTFFTNPYIFYNSYYEPVPSQVFINTIAQQALLTAKEYASYIASSPTYTQSYHHVADWLQEHTHQLEDACSMYQKALEYHPDEPDLWYSYSMFLANKYWDEVEQGQFISTIIRGFRKSYHLGQKAAPLYLLAIFYEDRLEDNTQAEKIYQELLAAFPDFTSGYNAYALLLLKEGNYEQAMAQAEQALLLLNPLGGSEHVYVYDTIAQIAWKGFGDVEKAAHYYDKAIVLYPEYPEAIAGAIEMYRQQNDLEKVIEWRLKRVHADPENAQHFIPLVQDYITLGNLQKARSFCQIGLKMDREEKTLKALAKKLQ